MPANKNALRRYAIIDRCIRNNMKPFPSRSWLQEKISNELDLHEPISIETVDKDIRDMKNYFNAPIVNNRERGGYYYDEENYSFSTNKITDEDLWVIDLASAAVKIYGDTNIKEKFISLAERLNTGSNQSDEMENVPYDCIQLEGNRNQQGFQWLYDLYYFVNISQTVEITYQPYGRDSKQYTLSPYLLKQNKSQWYLIAYSHEKKKTLVFALDRIVQMEKSKASYVYDPAFDKNSYFRFSFGVFHNWYFKPEKVQLRFSEKMRPYILSMPLHHTQKVLSDKDNGLAIEIEVFVEGNFELVSTILGYGPDVIVLSPNTLKEEIQNKVKEMQLHYSDN
jgi:predicted DNA-binding transcriptional regulator YafY